MNYRKFFLLIGLVLTLSTFGEELIFEFPDTLSFPQVAIVYQDEDMFRNAELFLQKNVEQAIMSYFDFDYQDTMLHSLSKHDNKYLSTSSEYPSQLFLFYIDTLNALLKQDVLEKVRFRWYGEAVVSSIDTFQLGISTPQRGHNFWKLFTKDATDTTVIEVDDSLEVKQMFEVAKNDGYDQVAIKLHLQSKRISGIDNTKILRTDYVCVEITTRNQTVITLLPNQDRITDKWLTITNNGRNGFSFNFYIDKPGMVSGKIFDLSGKCIALLSQGIYDKGEHELSWKSEGHNGIPGTRGLYVLRLTAENKIYTRSFQVIR